MVFEHQIPVWSVSITLRAMPSLVPRVTCHTLKDTVRPDDTRIPFVSHVATMEK